MNENSFLQYLLSNCDEEILRTSLDIVNPKKSTGSLAALDDFDSDEYQNFIRLSRIEEESAFGTEPFSGELMNPCHEATLLDDVLPLLVEYYDILYDDESFISISSVMAPPSNINVVNSRIMQYGRLRIGADIYGSVQAARYEKSSD